MQCYFFRFLFILNEVEKQGPQNRKNSRQFKAFLIMYLRDKKDSFRSTISVYTQLLRKTVKTNIAIVRESLSIL
jgi:hypothetical protein